MAPNDNEMDVKDLISFKDNAALELDGQVNCLTECLAAASLGGINRAQTNANPTDSSARSDVTSSEICQYPPGTTIDEQLLILAGVEDYHLSSAYYSGNAPQVELPPTPPEFGPLPSTPPMPSQNTTAKPVHWPNLCRNVESKYGWMTAYKHHELADATLPDDPHELAAVCAYMSDEIEDRWLKSGAPPVLPPKNHVWYPYWVPKHVVNELIEKGENEEKLKHQ
jgi:hypothetical protein